MVRNPIAFTSAPVTFFTIVTFAALFTSLLILNHYVPPPPNSPTPISGINITEAWHDLQHLSNGFHPYNSRRNNEIRNWLLQRIDEILTRNGVADYTLSNGVGTELKEKNSAVHVYNDLTSNLTFGSQDSALSIVYSGENVMTYIRGTEDDDGMWWEDPNIVSGKGGVLANAHYDSVPSGYGATDDGVGVVSVLQLISHFTAPGNTPKRGIVALLNNGEEDYLNGAYAFTQHPISKFPHIFLNLEGAGAGGRATLFRSTDTEVTKFYKKSPHPFGSVVSADGFKRGLVRSQTDYVVFNGELGMRGLDVAFMEPRARYHTVEDSTRFTSVNSLWHMLSGAIATMQGMSSDTSSTFDGDATVPGGVMAGSGTESVWFDVFGKAFAVFQLHTLFAISVTMLVVTPLILIALNVWLSKIDRWYLFARKSYSSSEEDDSVPIYGWKGFFRFPIVFVIATAALVGLAFLVTKINPYITYSSQYSVWSMMLTAWFVIAWFLLRGCDEVRPSAFQRTYALFWMYIGGFVVLAGATVLENNFSIAGVYFMVIYVAAVFLALLISYLELFALPRKTAYAQIINDSYDNSTPHMSASLVSSRPLTATQDNDERSVNRPSEDDDVTERTSLLRGARTTYSGGYGHHGHDDEDDTDEEPVITALPRQYEDEQKWSGKLPSWTWFFQFLLLAPVPIILVGQVALLMTSALYQTPSDGSPVLTFYLLVAIVSVLLLAPVAPFIHRFNYPIPSFLFFICVGTIIYNLLAFPFSENARLKVYFIQQVDLDTGINEVSLTGLMPYVKDIIGFVPSAADQNLDCSSPDYTSRAGLTKCKWHGIAPDVRNGKGLPKGVGPEKGYKDWVSFNSTKINNATNEAIFHISGKNTRACRLLFDRPIKDFSVSGFATDPRFPRVAGKGCKSIRLWNREWSGSWEVKVSWDDVKENKSNATGLDGKVVCLWSDANDPATIPAFTEVRRFMPIWSTVTKLSDGLVEGSKSFKV
ncbi:hypothetical protein EG327_009321 [Venturia inaequalis]|uniref:Peptide hydrolase n=1 Tax=Venturia inaequalis TaxID=5025 RepID=A0A8H3ZGE8_VENIN|nr:hypothetical protein EG327_009321 [Venturia inaequalis]